MPLERTRTYPWPQEMEIHLGEEMKFMYNSPLFLSASSLGKICEQSESLVIKGSVFSSDTLAA